MAMMLHCSQNTLRRWQGERILGIFLFVGMLSVGSLRAQTPATNTATASGAAASAGANAVFSNPDYQKLYNEAAQALQKKDYAAAIAKLDELDRAFPSVANSLNLRGAVYTEQRDFTKASEAFAKAAEIDKKAFAPRFNIAEVQFLQKKYPEARAKFEVLLAEDGKNDLVRYKVFLCYLANGEKVDAEKALNQFNFAGDMPAYYFAHAAWEFAANNDQEAQGWLQSASSIYPPQANMLFVDSLVELGYLKREEKKAQ